MYVKMSELVKRSGEPKSTITFYIKEGLLPAPRKYKPNLYLYHISTVDRLKYINLLKDKFNFSIQEIKEYMKKVRFEDSNPLDKLANTLALTAKLNYEPVYFENDVLIKCKISPGFLQKLIDNNIITPKMNKYSDTDLEIIMFAKQFENNEVVFQILKAYSNAAVEVARKEKEFLNNMIENDEKKDDTFILDIINDLKRKIFAIKTIEKIIN